MKYIIGIFALFASTFYACQSTNTTTDQQVINRDTVSAEYEIEETVRKETVIVDTVKKSKEVEEEHPNHTH